MSTAVAAPRPPLYITLREVSRIMGWSKKRTKRWLEREKALVMRGGNWVTTRDLLRTAFPEVYYEMATEVDDDDD